MPSLKNPHIKRKRGNRLATSFAKSVGEAGFDKDPTILKVILAICHDNNYKMRMDGVLFFKEYLMDEKVFKHSRFHNVYIPELIELLNDEEAYIRIEVIEIVTDILEHLDQQ